MTNQGAPKENKKVAGKLELEDIFRLGSLTQFLLTATQREWRVGSVEPDKSGYGFILYGLSDLKNEIEGIDWGEDIIEQIDRFINHLQENYSPDDNIKGRDAGNLNRVVSQWQQSIIENLSRETWIKVSNPGFFDVGKAMNQPEHLFNPDVWEWMSERSKEDFIQSCRALAINAPIASIMVSLRTAEDALRRWYEHETGEAIERESWGQVLSKIQEEYGEKGPSVLTDLSYLQDRRNEVNHPDRSPDWPEAVATIYRVRETISLVYQGLQNEEAEG
jgi:hypothetical protein